MRQEGYSKSGRNIIRNGHISGREAITSGEASPTGRHKKKTRTGLFCHIAATRFSAYAPPPGMFRMPVPAKQTATMLKFYSGGLIPAPG